MTTTTAFAITTTDVSAVVIITKMSLLGADIV